MKKAFIHITTASILSWVGIILFNLILRAVLGSNDDQTIRNLIAGVYFSAWFLGALLYVRYIRNGRGEDVFLSDYEKEKYTSMKNDIRLIVRHEKSCLYVFWLIVAVCFVINVIYIKLLGNTRVFILTMVYAMPLSWRSMFPMTDGVLVSLCGYLLSAVIIPLLYLITVLLYRRSISKRVSNKEKL